MIIFLANVYWPSWSKNFISLEFCFATEFSRKVVIPTTWYMSSVNILHQMCMKRKNKITPSGDVSPYHDSPLVMIHSYASLL